MNLKTARNLHHLSLGVFVLFLVIWVISIFTTVSFYVQSGQIPMTDQQRDAVMFSVWFWLMLLSIIPIGVFSYLAKNIEKEAQAKQMIVIQQQQQQVITVNIPQVSQPSSPLPLPPKQFCVFCGKELPQDALFCEYCGKKQK
jgi:uncharacterized protein with PQ loop repeat